MTTRDRLDGRHILLVEDEYFLADDLRQFFSDQGAVVIGPVGTVQDALRRMSDGARIDGAVLDINLGGEWAYAVADEFMRREIPFVFVTGYERELLPNRYLDARRCEKPANPEAIVSALFDKALQGAGSNEV